MTRVTCLTRCAHSKLFVQRVCNARFRMRPDIAARCTLHAARCTLHAACCTDGAALRRRLARQSGAKNCIFYTTAWCKNHNSLTPLSPNADPTPCTRSTEPHANTWRATTGWKGRGHAGPKPSEMEPALRHTHTHGHTPPYARSSVSSTYTTLHAPNFQLNLRFTGGALPSRLGRVVG